MITQRWRERRESYRPAREVLDTSRFGVELIPEGEARDFVTRHHYSGTFPAARVRVGLFQWTGIARDLVGAAVFSVPMSQAVVPRYTGQEPNAGVELGRFVLLDEVPANAETWFLARAFDALRSERPDVRAVVSYSDPVPRRDADGDLVLPGHVGTIYQAHNGRYLGRARGRYLTLTRDGRVVNARTLSKLRNDDRGAAYAYEQLLGYGAPARRPLESNRDYVARALADGPFRRLRHPGNHVYAWGLDRRARRQLVASAGAYPKARDHVHPAGTPRQVARLPFRLDAELIADLDEWARSQGLARQDAIRLALADFATERGAVDLGARLAA